MEYKVMGTCEHMTGRQANDSLFEAQNEAAAENTEVQGGEGRIRHWKEKTNHDYRKIKRQTDSHSGILQ